MGNILQKQGTSLAMSGGGFRATLFHLGSLWRLNEFGWLPCLTEITSVSGGSIISAFLGLKWKQLTFQENTATNFQEVIADPIREFCARTIDVEAVLLGTLLPFRHGSDVVQAKYREHLFGGATLQDLPAKDEGPLFTIYATNFQTGVSVRLSRPYIADYHLGIIKAPKIPLSTAVAASSGFPPIFCPVIIETVPRDWERLEGADLYDNVDMRSALYLGDGGIYDNMGLERAGDYENVLVSDAGAPFQFLNKHFFLKFSMVARTKRTVDIIDNQCRALRRRMLIRDFQTGIRKGTYWGIASQIKDYDLEKHGLQPIAADSTVTAELSGIRTRLDAFSEEEQGRLINWGYAMTDTAIRRHVEAKPMGKLPIPKYPL